MSKVDPNDAMVIALRQVINGATSNMGTLPTLLKRLLKENRWQSRKLQTGKVAEFSRFADFVTTPPLEGLGATVPLVRRLVQDDNEARDALDRETLRPRGGIHKQTVIVDNVHNDETPRQIARPDGNTAERALRALRTRAPEVHAEVLAGKLSPHAGMVKAGLRERTLTVPATPAAFARAALKHLGVDGCRALVDELQAHLEAS